MEEDLSYKLIKKGLRQEDIEKRLEEVVKEAEEIKDREAAANKELRFALSIIEEFLREKKRVCYGGTAMNIQLPESLRFYSIEKDLPDYDFFTPDAEKDVEEIVQRMRRAGFEEVSQRVGMHEGTKKIMVNYSPVADISEIDADIYNILEKRSVTIKGIHYTDTDVLRLMMYLELSRPKGEVSRWPKVFDRLTLINKAFPMKVCGKEKWMPKNIPMDIREKIYEYCVDHKRILAGSRLERIYSKSLHSKKEITWEVREGGAVIFISPDIKKDSLRLREALGFEGISIESYKAKGELIPPRLVILKNTQPIALILQETACHSYNIIKNDKRKSILIASLDTLITLYLSLALFTDDEEKIFGYSLMCVIQRFIDISNKLRKVVGKRQFPSFTLSCKGYQKTFATLVREKVDRISKEKAAAKIKNLLRKTRKDEKRRTPKRRTLKR